MGSGEKEGGVEGRGCAVGRRVVVVERGEGEGAAGIPGNQYHVGGLGRGSEREEEEKRGGGGRGRRWQGGGGRSVGI